MDGLRLYTFGSPRLELDGQGLHPDTRKAVAMLCVLALEGGSQRRDDLAGLLWSGRDMSKKRASLRRTLSALNSVLPVSLDADRQRVALPSAPLWVDALEFEALLAAARSGRREGTSALTEALGLYADHFLRGFNLRGCPLFDNWKLERSERLNRQLAGAFEDLLRLLEGQAAHEEAVHGARRWLLLDPLNEAAHRALMRSLAGAGQLGEALAHYDELYAALQRELGVDPSAESRALRAELLAQRARPRAASAPALQPVLFGRGRELASLSGHFDAGCRLVCLCGPGGVGKSSLARAWLARETARFAGGVCTLSAAALPAGVAEEQLEQWLGGSQRPGPRLALLDDCEARAGDAPGWARLLERWPELHLLVTSRVRLGLRGEQILELGGLAEDAGRELFLQEARKTRGVEAGADELLGFPDLCEALGGNPVCLRLAALWSRLLDCQELLAEWRRAPDFLASPHRNVPERHKSAHALFDASWQLLPRAARPVLLKLAELPSFEPAAIPELSQLAVLRDHSWLERVDGQRLRVVPWLAGLALRRG